MPETPKNLKDLEEANNLLEDNLNRVFKEPKVSKLLKELTLQEKEALARTGEDVIEKEIFGKISNTLAGFKDAFGDFVTYDLFTLTLYGYVVGSFILFLFNRIFTSNTSKCNLIAEVNERLF